MGHLGSSRGHLAPSRAISGAVSSQAELLAPYRLTNPLPPLPVDPKLLHHARDKEALVRFRCETRIVATNNKKNRRGRRRSRHRYETPIVATHPNVLTPEPDLGTST